jgi:hypothetical protein
MQPGPDPPFPALLAAAHRSAAHLEMRDTYDPDDPSFVSWLAGLPFGRSELAADWRALIGAAVARGVVVRRARIVSEPVTPYIRFEHAITDSMNIAAGELVRWLPRHLASGIALPGNDFWLFDDLLVRFGFFADDGAFTGQEIVTDRAVVRLCAAAFEAVWELAIDHAGYRPE